MGEHTNGEWDFWADPYVRELPPHGKLAFVFMIFQEFDDMEVIAEDMALATGLHISECQDWIKHFEAYQSRKVAA